MDLDSDSDSGEDHVFDLGEPTTIGSKRPCHGSTEANALSPIYLLGDDGFYLVVTAIESDDAFVVSQVCHDFAAAIGTNPRFEKGVRTHIRSVVTSVPRLVWARANGCPWNEDITAAAAGGGHLAMLQWARANGCPWDEWTCSNAAKGGHLAVLQWARANGCPWNSGTCCLAAQSGHLTVLQWARANGCPWNENTCGFAAEGGHLEVLQWARANRCPWNSGTCAYAAGRGHLAVLEWARANGCPK